MKTEFYNLIKDIIKTEEFQSMKSIKHHRYTNTYMHSIRVAYLCYLHYLKNPDKYDGEKSVKSS